MTMSANYANGQKRASEVAQRVTPSLTKDLKKLGLTFGSPVFIRSFKEEMEFEVWVQETYHLAYNIGYPNAYDKSRNRTGSFIMVHGSNVSIGCLAMSNSKIEEIYTLCAAALQNGQPFFRHHSFPFRMSETRMAAAAQHSEYPFWKNLKTGYEAFEKTKRPPNVEVKGQDYIFN